MTRTLVTAIVSGGQTGADRGGLQAAIDLGLGWGGWAPQGWRAEDGEVPTVYREHMRESASPHYGLRTRLNVQDSDGTLIVSFAENLSGGGPDRRRAERCLDMHGYGCARVECGRGQPSGHPGVLRGLAEFLPRSRRG